MERFFVPKSWINDDRVRLELETAHQIIRVFRLSSGDEISILDNSGSEYHVRIDRISGGIVEGAIIDTATGNLEPSIHVTLYQGILKGEKFEWILQKGTELGVCQFVPMICSRSIPRHTEKWYLDKRARWNKIVTEASEQSGRTRVPVISDPKSFQDACLEASLPSIVSIIPWEQEVDKKLKDAIRNIGSDSIGILIGPEGGFDKSEISLAWSKGITPVTIGKRILRAETAAIATLSIIFHELDNPDGRPSSV